MERSDDIPHGTVTGYSNYKCRCEACSEARRAYLRRHRAQNPERYAEYDRRYRNRLKTEREMREATGQPLGEFAERMNAAVKRLGLAEACRRAGVTRSTMYRWRKGIYTPPGREYHEKLKRVEKP